MRIKNRAFTLDELKIIAQANEDFENVRILLYAALAARTKKGKERFVKMALAALEETGANNA